MAPVEHPGLVPCPGRYQGAVRTIYHRCEPFGEHPLHVGLKELGDPHLGADAAAEALEAEQDPEEEGEVGREHELVVVQQGHPAAHDGVHVELADADEQVPVQPGLDGGPQLAHVDVGGRGGHVQDDVDQAVDVVGSNGDHQRLQLPVAHAGEAADIAEVENGHVVAVREEKVPRVRVGVVEAVPEDHLQVDIGGAVHKRVDVPPCGLDAGAVLEGPS